MRFFLCAWAALLALSSALAPSDPTLQQLGGGEVPLKERRLHRKSNATNHGTRSTAGMRSALAQLERRIESFDRDAAAERARWLALLDTRKAQERAELLMERERLVAGLALLPLLTLTVRERDGGVDGVFS